MTYEGLPEGSSEPEVEGGSWAWIAAIFLLTLGAGAALVLVSHYTYIR